MPSIDRAHRASTARQLALDVDASRGDRRRRRRARRSRRGGRRPRSPRTRRSPARRRDRHRPCAPSRGGSSSGRPAHPARCARPRASRGWRARSPSPSRAATATSWCPRVPDASRSSSSTARASSSRSITACESLPRVTSAPAARRSDAEAMPSARSRSVVGHRQHQQWCPPSSPTSRPVTYTAWTAVNGWSSAPASASSSVGVRPCSAAHHSFSAGCSDTWACSTQPRSPAQRATSAMRRPVDGAHRVDGRADPHAVGVVAARRPASAHASTSPSENRRCVVVELDARHRRAGSTCRAA